MDVIIAKLLFALIAGVAIGSCTWVLMRAIERIWPRDTNSPPDNFDEP